MIFGGLVILLANVYLHEFILNMVAKFRSFRYYLKDISVHTNTQIQIKKLIELEHLYK